MILGPISLIDCAVFLFYLVPQLLLEAGLLPTLAVAVEIIPFFLRLPFEFVWERHLQSTSARTAWVQGSTAFEDLVIRCVRYAFANIPPRIGGVFFSKAVALPFFRWRMLRHGYRESPVHWEEVESDQDGRHFKGIWVKHNPQEKPDFVLYYIHGGGFVLGSSYFYLEFLMATLHLLVEAGWKNPAIFTLEYTLAPNAVYPSQIEESAAGYQHVLDVVQDPSKVCIAGDSAGGTMILSLLLELGAKRLREKGSSNVHLAAESVSNWAESRSVPVPRIAVLISPWVTLTSTLHRESKIDFLDREALWRYAHQYARSKYIEEVPASPGCCTESALWKASTPQRGFYVVYGNEEVLGPDIDSFLSRIESFGIEHDTLKFTGDCGVHAWPVVSLFLSSTTERRLKGLRSIVREIRARSLESVAEKNGDEI